MALAAALLSSGAGSSADCLQQVAQGAETLINPEPGFFIIGKQLGQASSGGDFCTHACSRTAPALPAPAHCPRPRIARTRAVHAPAHCTRWHALPRALLRMSRTVQDDSPLRCRHEIVRPGLKVFAQDRAGASGNGSRAPYYAVTDGVHVHLPSSRCCAAQNRSWI
jgi:hypothetical protein